MSISKFAETFSEIMDKNAERVRNFFEGKSEEKENEKSSEEKNKEELLKEISQKLDLLLKKFEKSV